MNPVIVFYHTTEDGGEEELSVICKYEVCERCRGKGTHVNPAIDGNGITQADRDDWADDDFMEDYMSGVYDVRCEECNGNRVVPIPDEERNEKWVLDAYAEYQYDKWAYRAEIEAERRMGA